ncbi:MAG: cupredoxin family copper-binding protein [Candidatus Moranbacteria bacterium]|nr:cupredoxin family copper-binding protein [Candidatus Moranbacteria bacterium]
MKKSASLILAVSAVFFLGGCGYQASKQIPPVQIPGQSAQTGASTVGEASTVAIKNFSFSPSTLTVKAGTTVTWTNEDSAAHTIKSDTFGSGELSNGQQFDFKFEKAGSFDYSCAIHPSMTGKIIVE